MFDCHIHTQFSTDSSMKIENAIKRAEELKTGLIITEHMDLNFPIPGKFVFDVNEYFRTYSKYRGDKLLLGLEMGMRPDCIDENELLQETHNFDYIIGSVHVVDNIDIYEAGFYEGKSKREIYENYFGYMLDCVKAYDFIDSLAHIDYISRYARIEDKEIYYSEFSDYIDEILMTLIKKDKALELNTRRLGDKRAADNLIHIYRRFKQLGGKYITIGSDSHHVDDIGGNFDNALDIAKMCSLDVVYFRERVPVAIAQGK